MLELIVQEAVPHQKDRRGTVMGPFKSEQAARLCADYILLCSHAVGAAEHIRTKGKWYVETYGARLMRSPARGES